MANIFRATGSKFAGAVSRRASILTGRRRSQQSIVPVTPGPKPDTPEFESDSDEDEREVQTFLNKMRQRIGGGRGRRKGQQGRRGSKQSCHSGSSADFDDDASLSARLLSQVRQAFGKTKQSDEELSLESLLSKPRVSLENMAHIEELRQNKKIVDLLQLLGVCYGCPETQAKELVKFIANEAFLMSAKHSEEAARKIDSLTKQAQVAQQKLIEVKSACMKEISTLKAANSRRVLNQDEDVAYRLDVSHLDSMQLLDPESKALAERCMKDKVEELLARKDAEIKQAVEAATAKSLLDLKQAGEEQQRLIDMIGQLQGTSSSTGQNSGPKMRKKQIGDVFEEEMQQEAEITLPPCLKKNEHKNDAVTPPGFASLSTSLSEKPAATGKKVRSGTASSSSAPRKQANYNVSEAPPSPSSSRRSKKN